MVSRFRAVHSFEGRGLSTGVVEAKRADQALERLFEESPFS
jgi:hypothetical protein